MIATITKKYINGMQRQRVYINAEFLAALNAQKYEFKCQSFVNLCDF